MLEQEIEGCADREYTFPWTNAQGKELRSMLLYYLWNGRSDGAIAWHEALIGKHCFSACFRFRSLRMNYSPRLS